MTNGVIMAKMASAAGSEMKINNQRKPLSENISGGVMKSSMKIAKKCKSGEENNENAEIINRSGNNVTIMAAMAKNSEK